MKTNRPRKLVIGGALLSFGVAAAGVALPAGTAGAIPPGGPFTWCPGDPPVETGNKKHNPVIWDESICHEYWFVYSGQGNVAKNIWDGPNPPAEPATGPARPLPPLPPGMCWPGGLIPVPIPC